MAYLSKTEGKYTLLAALLFPVLILIIIRYLFKSFFFTRPTKLPPGPTPWPILGNIPLMMGSMPHVTLTNLAKTYGPLMSLKLGTQIVIVGSSSDIAREFYKTKDKIYLNLCQPPRQIVTSNHSDGLKSTPMVGSTYDEYAELRGFNHALQSQVSIAEKNVNHLIHFLTDRQGEVLNIAELVFATISNILGNALVSRSFIGLGEKIDDVRLKGVIMKALQDAVVPSLADFYPILGKLDLQGLRINSTYQLRRKTLKVPNTEQQKETKENSFGRQDILATLLTNDFTNNQINKSFVELFAAATDTTTTIIKWAMAELIRNPKCMTKVRAEIESESKQDFPKNFHLMQLPYLGACIKETLRLHPPGPLAIPERASETCQVMNYTIPKDAQVLVNIWAIGRDPSIWEQPLVFKPERFLRTDIEFKGDDFEFLPFSGGRRICQGLPMAARNIPLVIASLTHFFHWELSNGYEVINMTEKSGFTTCMEHPLSLLLKARILP